MGAAIPALDWHTFCLSSGVRDEEITHTFQGEMDPL
jgi:hypothetical protein